MGSRRLQLGLFYLLSAAMVCRAQPIRQNPVEITDRYADEYQVPRELIYSLIEVESGWKPYVVSEKGAAGMMQLMPETAATLGVANRFDLEQNIRAGVAYIARLLRLFEGDVRLAAAAYFAGEGRILRSRLNYSNADVYRYVSRLTHLYRQKRARAGASMTIPLKGDDVP